MRNPSILSHGWIEEGKIVCYEEIELENYSSKKVGEPILYTKNNGEINLN